MILSRIEKRASEMVIAHYTPYLVFTPVAHKKSNFMQNPYAISLKSKYFHGYRTKYPLIISAQSPTSLSATRVSRATITESQNVLFDYLSCTRSLRFTDADHISKNSPHFLQTLLSKIDSENDVTTSLTKFLRYNPINEFEPFFESLGLNPSELKRLLPQHLMYLSDDSLMLENFHVLCNYGIPPSNIGKMYKEARDIFRYDYGVLEVKLRSYENLGLTKPTVIKLASCCPSLLIGGIDTKFILVLERLELFGISPDCIGGYIYAKRTYYWDRILDTIHFLDNMGYSMNQLRNLLKSDPAFVFEGSGKNLHVLFGSLLKLGLKMDQVYNLLVKNPHMLSAKCARNFLKAVDFLLHIEMGTEDIANIVSIHMNLMGSCSLKQPTSVCKSLKVGKDDLRQIIKEEPLKLFSLASKSKLTSKEYISSQISSKYMEKSSFLMRLGYIENSEEMMKALKQFRGRGDQLQERFDCLVSAGLDYNVVVDIIKQAPMVLNQSKDVIEKKINCLTNFLGYPVDSIVVFPAFLCYDMKRINHRFSMYVWLRERGAAKPMLSLSTILACSEARFVKYFVDIHPEGPETWEKLRKSSALT